MVKKSPMNGQAPGGAHPPHLAPEDDGDHLKYLLTAYLFNNLSDAGRREVEAHLQGCASCRERLETSRQMLGEVETALEDEGRTYVFEEHRRKRVMETARQAQFRLLPYIDFLEPLRTRWKLSALAALLLLLVVGGLLLPVLGRSRQYSAAKADSRESAYKTSAPAKASSSDERAIDGLAETAHAWSLGAPMSGEVSQPATPQPTPGPAPAKAGPAARDDDRPTEPAAKDGELSSSGGGGGGGGEGGINGDEESGLELTKRTGLSLDVVTKEEVLKFHKQRNRDLAGKVEGKEGLPEEKKTSFDYNEKGAADPGEQAGQDQLFWGFEFDKTKSKPREFPSPPPPSFSSKEPQEKEVRSVSREVAQQNEPLSRQNGQLADQMNKVKDVLGSVGDKGSAEDRRSGAAQAAQEMPATPGRHEAVGAMREAEEKKLKDTRLMPPADPSSDVVQKKADPPDISAQAQLGDRFETIDPDRPDTQSAYGYPNARKWKGVKGKDAPEGGGGSDPAKTLDDLIASAGSSSPGTGGGWGGGNGTGDGNDIGAGHGSFGSRSGGGRKVKVMRQMRHGGHTATEPDEVSRGDKLRERPAAAPKGIPEFPGVVDGPILLQPPALSGEMPKWELIGEDPQAGKFKNPSDIEQLRGEIAAKQEPLTVAPPAPKSAESGKVGISVAGSVFSSADTANQRTPVYTNTGQVGMTEEKGSLNDQVLKLEKELAERKATPEELSRLKGAILKQQQAAQVAPSSDSGLDINDVFLQQKDDYKDRYRDRSGKVLTGKGGDLEKTLLQAQTKTDEPAVGSGSNETTDNDSFRIRRAGIQFGKDIHESLSPDASNLTAAEAALRGFRHFHEENEKLTFPEYMHRPAPVPPPVVTDEGLDEDEFVARYGIRPFVDAARDNLSTFAMDVDTASYTLARARLRAGRLPDPESVRTEAFVNYFPQPYRVEGEEAFGVFAEGGPSLFDACSEGGLELLKIGVKSRQARPAERRPASLTFVVDTSGSMSRDDQLSWIRGALAALVKQLAPEDAACIVAFGGSAEVVLPRTPARQKARILDAIATLSPRGGTNVEAGLSLGYRMADEAYAPEAINRVILCSDGVANIGPKGPEEILKRVKVFAARGIDLITVGFGQGQYNDAMMQRLSNVGNGSNYFVDRPEEAKRIFREQLPAHVDVLARDAKVQVEFNAQAVARYRLLGYENRKLADKDFRNDAVDAPEVAHNTLVTALYEIQRKPGGHGPLGKVFLRWKDGSFRHQPVVERNFPLSEGLLTERPSPELRFLACTAEFAELLRGSRWARDGSYAAVRAELYALPPEFRARAEWKEIAELVERAQRLSVETWVKQAGGAEK